MKVSQGGMFELRIYEKTTKKIVPSISDPALNPTIGQGRNWLKNNKTIFQKELRAAVPKTDISEIPD